MRRLGLAPADARLARERSGKESVGTMSLLAWLLLPMLTHSPAAAKPPLVPVELTVACAKHAAGSPCTASMDGHTMKGTCTPLPDHTLACRPSSRSNRPSPQPAPPPSPTKP